MDQIVVRGSPQHGHRFGRYRLEPQNRSKPGSHVTHRWREGDSNCRSLSREVGVSGGAGISASGFQVGTAFCAKRPRIMAALSLARRGRVSRGLIRHCAARLAQEPRSFSAGVFASLDIRWGPNRVYIDFARVEPGAVEEGRSYGGLMVRIHLPPARSQARTSLSAAEPIAAEEEFRCWSKNRRRKARPAVSRPQARFALPSTVC